MQPSDIDGDKTTLITGGASGPLVDAPEDLARGARVHHYRLDRILGEGGMGQVWLADQLEPIQRRVALKLIRRQIAGKEARANFEVERQALARMDHPAIARIYEAGTLASGFPWFAMEFIDGTPLDSWCRNTAPSLETRLRVFITLCRGVQHAHQRGVLHRDLKPSNVLVCDVDGRPVPRVIDFGIATGLDQSGRGNTGKESRAGTEAYMSPEQAGENEEAIDARSDVYSLGVILLTLLLPDVRLAALGKPVPVRQALLARVADAASGRRRIPGTGPRPLMHVVARAIQPDPAARYDSAAALAEDLIRFLDRRPVEAAPPSRVYRITCFVDRHRLPSALGLGLVAALTVGLGVALWALQRAEAEAARANAVAAFTSDLLSGINPDVAQELDTALMKRILQEGAEHAAEQLASQPTALAEIELTLAKTYGALGEFTQALAQAERARDRIPQRGHHVLRISADREYARLLLQIGDLDTARSLLEASLQASQARLGALHPKVLAARETLVWTLRDQGLHGEALPLGEALVIDAARAPDAPPSLRRSVRALMATLLADTDRFDEAIALMDELIAAAREDTDTKPSELLGYRNSHAVYHLQARRFAEGEALLRGLLPDYARIYGEDSSMTLVVVGNLAGALRQQGKIEEAGPFYLRAADHFEASLGPDAPFSLMTRHNYGNWLLDMGRAQEALELQRDVARRWKQRLGEANHPSLAETLTSQGKAELALGDLAAAEASLQASVDMKIALRGPDNTRLIHSYRGLADLHAARGDDAGAARYAALASHLEQ